MSLKKGDNAKVIRKKNGRASHYLRHGVIVTIIEVHFKNYGEKLPYEYHVAACGRDFLKTDQRFGYPDKLFDQFIVVSEIVPVSLTPGIFEKISKESELPNI